MVRFSTTTGSARPGAAALAKSAAAAGLLLRADPRRAVPPRSDPDDGAHLAGSRRRPPRPARRRPGSAPRREQRLARAKRGCVVDGLKDCFLQRDREPPTPTLFPGGGRQRLCTQAAVISSFAEGSACSDDLGSAPPAADRAPRSRAVLMTSPGTRRGILKRVGDDHPRRRSGRPPAGAPPPRLRRGVESPARRACAHLGGRIGPERGEGGHRTPLASCCSKWRRSASSSTAAHSSSSAAVREKTIRRRSENSGTQVALAGEPGGSLGGADRGAGDIDDDLGGVVASDAWATAQLIGP